jgi:uncharacterized protein (DUF1810 family)
LSDLERFVAAQDGVHDTAVAELRAGRKRTHWMWFVFPQLSGLGSSPTARKYAIASLAEAREYLAHPVLGPRLHEAAEAMLSVEGRNAGDILGYPDDLKLRSSMTLFGAASPEDGTFAKVLIKYYDSPDPKTLELLNEPAS